VRRAPKTALIRFASEIAKLRKQLKTAKTPAQKKAIREKIIRVRVIKGGRSYLTRCNKRILRYQALYKKTKSASNQTRLEVCIRRYY